MSNLCVLRLIEERNQLKRGIWIIYIYIYSLVIFSISKSLIYNVI